MLRCNRLNLFRDIFPAARCVLLICFLSTTNTPQLAAGIFYCRDRVLDRGRRDRRCNWNLQFVRLADLSHVGEPRCHDVGFRDSVLHHALQARAVQPGIHGLERGRISGVFGQFDGDNLVVFNGRRGKPIGTQGTRGEGDQGGCHVQLARDRPAADRAAATEQHPRELPRIEAAPQRHQPDFIGHACVDDTVNARGGLQHR